MPGIDFAHDIGTVAFELGLKFLVALLCGGVVGFERETSGKPAGVRTNILICLGSMLFTAMSFELARTAGGDPTRVAAQIVTGIGFLGAGAILHESGKGITGMTTAAMIWLIAALGMMIGAGYLLSAVAITAATTLTMVGLRRVERYINQRRGLDYAFVIPSDDATRGRLESVIGIFDDVVSDVVIASGEHGRSMVTLHFSGSVSERHEFLQQLFRIEGLRRRDVAVRGEETAPPPPR